MVITTEVCSLLDCCPPSVGLCIDMAGVKQRTSIPLSCPQSAPKNNQKSSLCLLPWPTSVITRSPGLLMTTFPNLSHFMTMRTPSLSPAGDSSQKRRMIQRGDGKSGTGGRAGLGEDVTTSFCERFMGMGRCGGRGNSSKIFSGSFWLFPWNKLSNENEGGTLGIIAKKRKF